MPWTAPQRAWHLRRGRDHAAEPITRTREEPENGHSNPSVGSLARIAAGLNLPLTALVTDVEVDGDLRGEIAAIAALVAAQPAAQRRRALRVLTSMFED